MSRDRREKGGTDFSGYFEPLGTIRSVNRIGIDFFEIAGGTGESCEASDEALQIRCQFLLKKDQRWPIEVMFGRTDHGHELEIISTP